MFVSFFPRCFEAIACTPQRLTIGRARLDRPLIRTLCLVAQVVNDKWKCYGKALFNYLLFFNSLALIFVTLAGCTALDTATSKPDWAFVPTTDMILVDGEFVMPPEDNVSDSEW